jgi:putative membrane protein (TIGR04086 family)
VIYGLITIFVIAMILSLILSIVLRFSSLQEQSFQLFITIVSFIGLFIGGFISGGKAKEKGWLIGGLTGGGYTLIIFLYQYLGHDTLFTVQQWIYHTCYVLVAMMGGILGVNLIGGSHREAS